ncbi:hypothetical protein CKQ80_09520 [Pseudomonas moraviensis]|uniref:Uncharacterized protein n=1 Tax=Pseudomonas moraviensis TaxID=321662 RepID=A0A2A2PJC4_9PSED|nr:hypothetical protein [Pseudomonas moraviensis]PAW51027.1 hypothetical protein CKQ68_27355 [Pseudomonas moraviensis]PAW55537.1 hypothetical protein CKQ80_09520 [Pseudomonas moraviensis]
MTVPTLNSIAEFSTNGVTTNFPFFFKFLANEDLIVTYVDPNGVSSTLNLGSQYTVSGAGNDAGGSIVTSTALAGPGQLVVSREMDAYQQTSLRNQGKFLAETHEDVFDRLTMLIQQGFSIFKRALVRPFGRDYYDAENRIISNVKNPVAPQDAATKYSVEDYVSGILQTGAGPINNAFNVLYSDGTSVGTIIRDRLARSVANMTEFRSINPAIFTKINLLCHTVKGFGGGIYFLDTADTASADNNGTVIVIGTSRYKFVGVPDATTFGVVGDGATMNNVAHEAYYAWVRSKGGGTLNYPAGATYKFNDELLLNPISGIGFHNIIIQGVGIGAAIFDFSACAAGKDGIGVIGWGGRCGLRNLKIQYAKAVGVNWNKGAIRGGVSTMSRTFMENVIVEFSGSHGVQSLDSYMQSFRDVESRNNGGNGFKMSGFHTSFSAVRCWGGGDAAYPVGGNQGAGWDVNGMIYSNFQSCSADGNSGPGWVFSNMNTTVLSGCGAESNGQEGYLVRSSSADISGLPTIVQNIKGLIFDGCFAVTNSRSSPNIYANFLGASTANSRNIELVIRGCTESGDASSTVAYVLLGNSGAIFTHEQANSISGTTTATGTVSRQNNTAVGRTTLVQLSADQSIPNATDTAVNFTVQTTNRMVATISGGAVVIPSGVNRIKVTAGVYWASSSTGSRTIRFQKNGVTAPGLPQQKSVSSGVMPQTLTSAIIEVAAGDAIGLVAAQDSTAALSIVNNGSTYMSVEVIG